MPQAGSGYQGGSELLLFGTTRQDIDFIEFYAGKGNLHRMMRAAGRLKALRFDLKDNEGLHRNSNFMDLNASAGFACLSCMFSCLQGCPAAVS